MTALEQNFFPHASAHPPCCGACGAPSLNKAFDALEPGFEVRDCARCGYALTWPAVGADQIKSYYPESYYGKENIRFNALFEYLTRLFRWRRARVIRRRVSRGPVLDVGCGRGFMLSYLRSLGYESHGIEVSDTAAWHARNALGLRIETGDFVTAPHQTGFYNAVILWHSLEHLPKADAALSRASSLLKKGGFLVVAVPNRESLQARLFGPHWFHLDIPRHYHHFSSRSLRELLEECGFVIEQEDHFSFEQNPYGWIQSFYNAIGFEHNFLYSVLKNRSARTTRIRRHPFQAILMFLLLPVVTAAGVILTVLEAAMRRGGTVEIYAVKR